MVEVEKRAARKLSPRDESDLSWFHTLGPGDVSAIKAQSYEPRGASDSNDNDPLILRRLSARSIAHAARFRLVEGVRLEVMKAPDGQTFVAWLGLAYAAPRPGDPHAMFPERPISGRVLWRNANPHPAASLARHTPTAQERGREEAEMAEHERVVRLAYNGAAEQHARGIGSSLSIVESVLKRDAATPRRARAEDVTEAAARAVERACRGKKRDEAFCQAVREEALAMWTAAGSAFSEARAALSARYRKERVAPEPPPSSVRLVGRRVVVDNLPAAPWL